MKKMGKLDLIDTKRLVLGYCEGPKLYGLIYLQITKIMKSREVIFMYFSSGWSKFQRDFCPCVKFIIIRCIFAI